MTHPEPDAASRPHRADDRGRTATAELPRTAGTSPVT